MKKTILTVNETVQRSHEEGMPISDYSLPNRRQKIFDSMVERSTVDVVRRWARQQRNRRKMQRLRNNQTNRGRVKEE